MKLSAICKICANAANYSYRHAETAQGKTEQIGGAETYMPLCRECFKKKIIKEPNLGVKMIQSESKSVSTNNETVGENFFSSDKPKIQ